MNRWLRYLGACTILSVYACSPDFPDVESTTIVELGAEEDVAFSPQDTDSVRPVDAGMPVPNTPVNSGPSHQGRQDTIEYFGICDRTIRLDEELLANDMLSEELRLALETNRPNFEVVITEQPSHGLISVNSEDLTARFEPAQLGQTTFEYAIRTPSGTSTPTLVTLRQPVGSIAIEPSANEGAADRMCSLREAIQVANDGNMRNDCGARESDNVVIVFAERGAIRLALNGEDDDDARTGDLDVRGDVTIIGCSPETTRITADHESRVFEVHPRASLTLKRMRISKGQADIGGGLLNRGTVNLDDVSFFANHAVGEDGEPGERRGGCGGGGGSAGIGGAVVTLANSTTTITGSGGRCLFDQNKAQGGDGGASLPDVAVTGGGRVLRRYCGGAGGGPQGGIGGQLQGFGETDGGPGFGISGGGGGGGGLELAEAGVGGPGAFGGGGGGGGNTPGASDPQPGRGGFAGGAGAPGPLDGVGGGGGGGAALGAAIAALGGVLQVTGCRFNGNRLQPGEGGGTDRLDLSQQRGESGRAYGRAIFSIGNLVDVSDSGEPDWVACDEVEPQLNGQCASLDL